MDGATPRGCRLGARAHARSFFCRAAGHKRAMDRPARALVVRRYWLWPFFALSWTFQLFLDERGIESGTPARAGCGALRRARIPRMSLVKSHVFWLSYEPASGESIRDVLRLLRRVMAGSVGVFGGNVVSDGHLRMEMVVCSSNRHRVGMLGRPDNWQRKGARGRLLEVLWPGEGQSPRDFLYTRAGGFAGARGDMFGSLSEASDVMEYHYSHERERKRERRRRRGVPLAVDAGGPEEEAAAAWALIAEADSSAWMREHLCQGM